MLLGQGHFGAVWRAFDHHLGRELALKLLQKGSPLVEATDEAHRLTALESPHILRVFNADVFQDIPYLATEIAEEGSAEDRMGPHGVSPELAIRWVRHVLVGLAICHGQGLLHRDIKASNIFLKNEDHALLGDFGVAALVSNQETAPAHGDLRIQAPEMISTGFGTVRSDLYSVGVALYTLLAGVYPFQGNNPAEISAAITSGNFVSVRDAAPHVPQALAKRVSRAMAIDPAARYQTAVDFHTALSQLHFTRIWQPITPHGSHFRCWSGTRRGRTDLSVCVRPRTGGGFSVETRRPNGKRILAACSEVPNEARLGVMLRRVFRQT